MKKRIIFAVTGASGAPLALNILRALHENSAEIHLVISSGAMRVIHDETSADISDFTSLADFVYDEREMGARISSGSFRTDGMIIAPCSMKTLSGIVSAYDDNLIVRAADVCLKERRKVVLMPRETPLNNAHLRNMLSASQDGCVILPPVLGFYSGAETLQAQLDQLTGKVLMQFDMEFKGFIPWAGSPQ